MQIFLARVVPKCSISFVPQEDKCLLNHTVTAASHRALGVLVEPGTHVVSMSTMSTPRAEAGEARAGQPADGAPDRGGVAKYAPWPPHGLSACLTGGGDVGYKHLHVGGDG